MNKQELIDILKRQLEVMPGASGGPYDGGYEYATKHHLAMIADLDEPEKHAVPQFVADWLEVCKDNLALSLASSMNPIVLRTNNQHEETIHWFKSAKNQETFAKAWLYGYEVEKEKLYTVEIPNPISDGYTKVYLGRNEDNKVGLCILGYYSATEFAENWKQLDSAKLTESEIKEDFEWAFQFAEEVEE